MNIAYVRVSSVDQNEARQVEALKKFEIEKWFSEKISGKNINRPKFQEMMEFVREGDDVYIHGDTMRKGYAVDGHANGLVFVVADPVTP